MYVPFLQETQQGERVYTTVEHLMESTLPSMDPSNDTLPILDIADLDHLWKKIKDDGSYVVLQ